LPVGGGVPLRILFCTLNYHPGSAGGTERQARLQAEELVRRGHELTVVCPRVRGITSGVVGGVQVRRLPRIDVRPFRTLSYLCVLALYLAARVRSFELVHVHLANLQADVAVFVARVLHRPVYVKVACGGSAGEVSRFRRVAWLTRWFGLRYATRVQALSREIADELQAIRVRPDRIVLLPNGVDREEFTPVSSTGGKAARRRLELPAERPIALFMGRFARYKGIADLLDAWEGLPETDALLVLVGTTATDKSIKAPPAGRNVLVRDWTTAAVDYLHAADVFVYPSHADGMSNALLEALACGLALVVTRLGSTEELVSNGYDALVVEPHDPAGLAAALERVLRAPELRTTLARNAASTAARYSVPAVVDGLEQAYREIPCPSMT